MPQPRLWGPWVPVLHPSGACLAALASGDVSKPTLYVFSDPLPDTPLKAAANRRVMVRVLADYLSGGDRPAWLDDYYPRGPHAAECLTGSMLVATGPWLRQGEQSAVLVLDQSAAAKRARRRLIRAILDGSPGAAP